jgi:phage terminase Nu1 subunit (DNA packaging protein)
MPGNIAIVVSGKCRHDRYHLDQIRRWLAERESEARAAGRRTRRPK